MEIERRVFKIEVRKDEKGARVLAGTPIVYDKNSEDMGFIETISRGAATDALRKSDPRLLYGHNSDTLLPLARQSAGTLRSTEDSKGVHIEADPPQKNVFVDALMESIERGDIGEMSFGFTIESDKWDGLDSDMPTRTILKMREIFDYSYVAFAAYNDTTVALRSLALAKETKDDSNDDEFIITVRAKGLDPEEIDFGFEDQEEAQKFITDIRSLLSPMTDDSDSTEDEPMLKKSSGEDEDDLLDKIKNIQERYEK